jgi:hypothetical protein
MLLCVYSILNKKKDIDYKILKFSYSITYHMFRLVPLRLLVLGIIFTQFFLMPFEFVLAQSVDEAGDVTGNAVNSKYVTITNHRYQQGNFSDMITGQLLI